MRGRPDLISLNEREFIANALNEGLRIDGRSPYDYRELSITFRGLGHAEASIGSTRCMCSVSAEIVEPPPERPNAGILQTYCELSPMAAPEFRPGRASERAVEIGQILERGLKQSKAVDTEALCILAGRKVWQIRLDVHVLDHCGNMIDCANLAAIAALRHFKKPEVQVSGEEVKVFSAEERQPTPLSILHSPLSVSICFISPPEEAEEEALVVVDPLLKEEECASGSLTLTQNSNRELCGLQKLGGVGLSVGQLLKCNEIAAVKVQEMAAFLQRVLDEDAAKRPRVPAGRTKRRFEEDIEEPAAPPVLGPIGVLERVIPSALPKNIASSNQTAVKDEVVTPAEEVDPEQASSPMSEDEPEPAAPKEVKPEKAKLKKKLKKTAAADSPAASGGLDLSSALLKKKKKKK